MKNKCLTLYKNIKKYIQFLTNIGIIAVSVSYIFKNCHDAISYQYPYLYPYMCRWFLVVITPS